MGIAGAGASRTHAQDRIGLIIPSSNTVAESDFQNGAHGATVHTARMHLVNNTRAEERSMLEDHLPQAVADIASTEPDVVAFACTTAGALLGPRGESELIGRIQAACGVMVVSTNAAVGAAIERHHPNRVAVVTPYVDELNAAIQASLEARHIVVSALVGMGLVRNQEIGRVTPAAIVAFAVERLANEDFDLLFVPCTNFRAAEAAPELCARLDVPVVTSNGATLEATLDALGTRPRPRGSTIQS
jgi:maleate isomerase